MCELVLVRLVLGSGLKHNTLSLVLLLLDVLVVGDLR